MFSLVAYDDDDTAAHGLPISRLLFYLFFILHTFDVFITFTVSRV